MVLLTQFKESDKILYKLHLTKIFKIRLSINMLHLSKI